MKGKVIGYVRVSTVDQNPDRQLEGLMTDKKFTDYASGKTLKRPQLEAMLDYVREDDRIVVHSMDRLARNVKDLLDIVEHLSNKKVEIQFLKENLTFNGTDSAISKLLLVIIGAVAEFERELILERQREGIALAQKAGKYKGKPTKLNKLLIEKIKQEMTTRKTKADIARDLGISRFSLYRYLEAIKSKEGVLT
jgi:DNA invertase Pin-like site-specific DNA recombinase